MEKLIPALQKDDELLKDIQTSNINDGNFRLWWLGQSGYLIQYEGQHLLIDPYLSDSLTKKYATTPKPHIRMSELAINPANLNMIDIVTSSHNHTDHLDGETLKPLLQVNTNLQLLIPEANRSFVAERIQMPLSYPIGLDAGEQKTIGHFTFIGVPAAHEGLDKDERGKHKFLGYVVQFGTWSIYHSGDTIWYDGMSNILQEFDLDISILPINGKDAKRKVAGNLNAEEAVLLGKEINTHLVIPCHYDMFTFNTADPEEFRQIADQMKQPYVVLQVGEKWVQS